MNLNDETVINILSQAKTGTQFINIAMTSERFLGIIQGKENHEKIKEIMRSLDMSHEKMPNNNFKLNVLLSICNNFGICADYLDNYKKAILNGDLHIAFEYNKRGIYRPSSPNSNDTFEEHILQKRGEAYLSKYVSLNSTKLPRDKNYPLMFGCFGKSSIGKNYRKLDDFIEYFISNYIISENSKLSSRKEDILTFLLYFLECGLCEKVTFEDFIKKSEAIPEQMKKSYIKDVSFIFNREFYSPSEEDIDSYIKFPVNTMPPRPAEGKQFINFENTAKKGETYITAVFGADRFTIKANDKLIKNSIYEIKKFEDNVIENIYSPYSFSWAVYLILTDNFFTFRRNFDMSYLEMLINDLEILAPSELVEKTIMEIISEMELSANFSVDENIKSDYYYYGDDFINLPDDDHIN